MSGTLDGIRVIELAAIGPVPFCGMLLADMGADVIRIDRVDSTGSLGALVEVCGRGKRSACIDLKSPAGRDLLLGLCASADVLIEGFRPGVAERLGIGPEVVTARNQRLVYGRMTGWGQEGPMAAMAGHDINYIGLVGALHAIGDEEPQVPLNLIADYGGGALYLLVGILAALIERQASGKGQTVDAAMIDGAASLMTPTYQLFAAGLWRDERAGNVLDGAAPFYRTYETADGRHVAVGALEPKFYCRLLELLEVDPASLPSQHDRAGWPIIATVFAEVFVSKPLSHWQALFLGQDACVTPVLSLEEAPRDVHNRARNTFMNDVEHPEPAPAPRFERTPSYPGAEPRRGAATVDVAVELGIDPAAIDRLVVAGVLGLGPT